MSASLPDLAIISPVPKLLAETAFGSDPGLYHSRVRFGLALDYQCCADLVSTRLNGYKQLYRYCATRMRNSKLED